MRRSFFIAVCVSSCVPADVWAYLGSVALVPPQPTVKDQVTVKISGDFPDGCWRFQGYSQNVQPGRITINVGASVVAGACTQALVPYTLEADLGVLPAGHYELTVTDPQESKTVGFDVTDGETEPGVRFHRGDSNTDGKVDISDPVATLGVLFLGEGSLTCLDAADANDDGALDLSDAVFTLLHLFGGGAPLPEPGPRACGLDFTPDALDCESFPPCAPGTVSSYALADIGIDCFTWPCPVWRAVSEEGEILVTDVDLSPFSLSREEEAMLFYELRAGRWRVRGYILPGPEGPAGVGTTLVVLELEGKVE
ncbi:MAG TPA: hypothetical protein VMT52_16935 [Planctomycetota bacterium]|nr:hypothetical protein [Planctomycetota bacterium]